MPGSAERPPADKKYERGGEEFARVLAFSDGMFAIAMTLLVVGIEVPDIADTHSVGDLWDALGDRNEAIFSFFISFAVIGRYWLAHHEMLSLLGAFDRGLVGLNLVYLGFIAFLPFPTAVLGDYFYNPLAVAFYAVAVAIVSGLEIVMVRHAHRHGLLTRAMSDSVYAWSRTTSLTPVVFFGLSIPLAFVSTSLAIASWFLTIVVGIALSRREPPEAVEYFG